MAIRTVRTYSFGPYVVNELEIDGPNPYTVGGQVYTAKQLGLGRVMGFALGSSVTKSTQAPAAALFGFLKANRQQNGSETLTVVFTTTIAGGTEAGAADLSAQQFRLTVWGNF